MLKKCTIFFFFGFMTNIFLFSKDNVGSLVEYIAELKENSIYSLFKSLWQKRQRNECGCVAHLLISNNKLGAGTPPEQYTYFPSIELSHDIVKKVFKRPSFFSGLKCFFFRSNCNYGIKHEQERQKAVSLMLEQNPFIINAVDKNNKTLLHLAAEKGDVNVIELLIKYNTQLNKQDDKGCTSLHYLVKNKPFDAEKGRGVIGMWIKNLINAGPDPNKKDNQRKTPIYYAIEMGEFFYVNQLIENGASLSVKNNQNQTPIEYAKELFLQKKSQQYTYGRIISRLER